MFDRIDFINNAVTAGPEGPFPCQDSTTPLYSIRKSRTVPQVIILADPRAPAAPVQTLSTGR